jgi:hypothetical protein
MCCTIPKMQKHFALISPNGRLMVVFFSGKDGFRLQKGLQAVDIERRDG